MHNQTRWGQNLLFALVVFAVLIAAAGKSRAETPTIAQQRDIAIRLWQFLSQVKAMAADNRRWAQQSVGEGRRKAYTARAEFYEKKYAKHRPDLDAWFRIFPDLKTTLEPEESLPPPPRPESRAPPPQWRRFFLRLIARLDELLKRHKALGKLIVDLEREGPPALASAPPLASHRLKVAGANSISVILPQGKDGAVSFS